MCEIAWDPETALGDITPTMCGKLDGTGAAAILGDLCTETTRGDTTGREYCEDSLCSMDEASVGAENTAGGRGWGIAKLDAPLPAPLTPDLP